MFKLVLKILTTALLASALLIALTLFISHYLMSRADSVELVSFIVGGFPIVIFLPGVFSKAASGALHTPRVIFRKAESPGGQAPDPRTGAGGDGLDAATSLGLALAGFLTWVAGYML